MTGRNGDRNYNNIRDCVTHLIPALSVDRNLLYSKTALKTRTISMSCIERVIILVNTIWRPYICILHAESESCRVDRREVT